MRSNPEEPTGDQCNNNEKVADFQGQPAFACWYPQMGGYCGKAVVVLEKSEKSVDSCFEVYIWHNGQFPFSETDCETDRVARIHHCSPSQFIAFGEFVLKLQESSQ